MFLPDGKRILISRGQFADMVAADLDGKTIATLPIRTGEFAVVAPGYLITASRNGARCHQSAQRLNLNSLSLEGPVVRLAAPRSGRREESIRFPHHQTASWHSCPAGWTARTSCTMPSGLLRDTLVRVDGTWTLGVRPPRLAPRPSRWPAIPLEYGCTILVHQPRHAGLVQDSTFPTTGFAFGTTHPVFNSDGTHLVYAMRGANRCRIMDRDLVTGAERIVGSELATASSSIWAFSDCLFPVDWSPDGRFLLTRSDTTLQIVPVDGSSEPRSIVRPGRVLEGRFAPDGHAVAYASDETGRAEVYDAGAAVLVRRCEFLWKAVAGPCGRAAAAG